MGRITQEVEEYLKNHLVFVATADKDGKPNVVPKGSVGVLDGDKVVFADLYSHQTRENLRQNPRIAITVANPAGYTGYQVKGRARVIEPGEEYRGLLKRLGGDGQLNHPQAKYAILVQVEEVIDIGYGDHADKEVG